MPPKAKKPSVTDIEGESSPNTVSLSLILKGDGFGPGDWNFLTMFNGNIIFENKWNKNLTLQCDIALDLKQPYYQSLLAEKPVIFLVRTVGGKGAKDVDALLNVDNRAGATFDLFPFVLGEREICLKVQIINIITGLPTGCAVEVSAKTEEVIENDKIPLMVTMISGHYFPIAREGTVYISAIALNDIQTHNPPAAKFGMSLSTMDAVKVVWASACNGGFAANTAFDIPCEDKFVPEDLELMTTDTCTSVYWNSMTRVLVDSASLRERLLLPFLVEVAGVPKVGKIEVRGRYMALVDAGVLLEPGQFGVTICARLLYYNESNLPEGTGALLELPPTSAKAVTARDTSFVTDESGHAAYIVMRFDVFDPLNAKVKITSLFDVLGFPIPEGFHAPINELYIDTVFDDIPIDIRRIRKEGGALAVHKELGGLSCRLQINQSTKKTAANRLLSRMRYLLKQFPPGECSNVGWEDTVTAQHAASRRAVTASFAPQPPPPRSSSRIATVRSRMAGDIRIADERLNNNLTAAPHHPRVLFSKALRCLEVKNNFEARTYLIRALSEQSRNRYLLWTFGGSEFSKEKYYEISAAALRIAVKGDTSDGTTGAVGWAALHALHHYNQDSHAAFVAARKMRKAYELPREWKKFIQRYVEISGEEEIFWLPATIQVQNPLLIAAAFFLCLRCYKFSERLLRCVEEGCLTRGSRNFSNNEITVDIFYIRAASLVLQDKLNKALEVTEHGIKQFGPSAIMSQMRAVCLARLREWDEICDGALLETDRAGAETCPWLLLRGAFAVLKSNPDEALQRAARAHKVAPTPFSALLISRVYANKGEIKLAERWAAAAVKTESLLADGWTFLAILAMMDRDVDRARAMLRTAKQAGPVSADIEEELRKFMKIVPIETMPGALVKDLCLCDYY